MFREEEKSNSNGSGVESKIAAADSKRNDDKSTVATLDYWRLARTAAFHAVALDHTRAEIKKHAKDVQEILQKMTHAVIDQLYQPKDLDKKKDELSWYNHSPHGIVARILTYCVVNKIELDMHHIAAMAADPERYLLPPKVDDSKGLLSKFFLTMGVVASGHRKAVQEGFLEVGIRRINVNTLPPLLLSKIKPWITQALSRKENFRNWNEYYPTLSFIAPPEMLPPIVPFEKIFDGLTAITIKMARLFFLVSNYLT